MYRAIVESGGIRADVQLGSGLTIGRNPSNDIVLLDDGAADFQARIQPTAGQYEISAATCGCQVLVNGNAIFQSRVLRASDHIQIGGTRLTIVAEQEDSDHGDSAPPRETGVARIRFACQCGQTLKATIRHAGRRVRCPLCERVVVIPLHSADEPIPGSGQVHGQLNPTASPRLVVGAGILCGACHSSIAAGEEKKLCPECHLPYHAECWRENLGCAAYGCGQVNSLKSGPDIRIQVDLNGAAPRHIAAAVGPPSLPPQGPIVDERLPWEYLWLPASAVIAVLGFHFKSPTPTVLVICLAVSNIALFTVLHLISSKSRRGGQ